MKIVIVLLCQLLQGCVLTKFCKPIELPEVTKPQLQIQIPQNPEIQDIKFKIIIDQETQESMISLSGNEYKKLSLNIKNILNFIIIQNNIIKEYQKYYESE